MAISSKSSTKPQVKSISLPCRSHPTTLHIHQQLNTAKTAAAFAASNPSLNTISNSLTHLAELYKCLDDLLNQSTTRVLISRNKKWVEQLIDESLSFLDVCGSLKDIVTHIKSHLTDLQCALRRRKSELSNQQSIMSYNCFRKKLKKDVKLLTGRLKQVDNMIAGDGSVVVGSDSDNHQIAAVMKAVIGVSEMTVSVFESLLSWLSMPTSKQNNRWTIVVSKLIHKGMVGCEDNQEQGIVDEFGKVEDALRILCKNGSSMQDEEVQIAKCRLEMMENRVECLEAGLECLFRRLIGNRASLLNIISM